MSHFADETKVVVELTEVWNTRQPGEKVEVSVRIADLLLDGSMAKKCAKGAKPTPHVRKEWDQGNLSGDQKSELSELVAILKADKEPAKAAA